jgi:hypothetical protein
MRIWCAVILGLGLSSGCSNELDGNNGTLIGLSCKTADDCDVAGVCITDGKGGLCSQTCMYPGRAQECPFGSYCDQAELTTDSAETSEMTLCLPSCKANSDCRPGYECSDVFGGPGKSCHPKPD